MLETSKNLVEATNNLMNGYIEMTKNSVNIEDIDPATLKLAQASLKLAKASNEYVTKVAEMINSINSKLDELLAK